MSGHNNQALLLEFSQSYKEIRFSRVRHTSRDHTDHELMQQDKDKYALRNVDRINKFSSFQAWKYAQTGKSDIYNSFLTEIDEWETFHC